MGPPAGASTSAHFGGGLPHEGGPELAGACCIPGEERAIGEHVHDAGDASREPVQLTQRGRGERLAGGSRRNAQAMTHVLPGLTRRQRTKPPAYADPLLELPEVGRLEHVVELRLPQQDDLDQLRRFGLEVREQADLLEGLSLEVLGLVDDQQHPPRVALLLDQETVEGVGQLVLRVAGLGEPELGVDRLQQLQPRELRIEDEGHLVLGAEPLEEGATQGRLPGSHLAGDDDEPLALLDSVEQVGERLAVRLREEQEPRVGAQREGLFAQTMERGIHPRAVLIEGATR